MPFVGLHKPQGQGHSWKNTRTAQTRLCYFSGLLCHFFASWHAITVLFAFCCENWHIRWMNRHPLSLKQTCCSMVFQATLMQIWNYCFCAISSHELFVCASTFFPTMVRGQLGWPGDHPPTQFSAEIRREFHIHADFMCLYPICHSNGLSKAIKRQMNILLAAVEMLTEELILFVQS